MDTQNLKTLLDKILVEILPLETKTTGGILLVPSNEKSNRGKVILVGPGKVSKKTKELLTPSVSVGDLILFYPNSGVEVTIDDGKFLILTEADIMGVLE